MLTYVYFGTNDLARATRFYDATLTPLGMQRCVTGDPEWDRISAGWGTYEDEGARELAFWIGKPFDELPATTGNGSMVSGHNTTRISMPRTYVIRMATNSLPFAVALQSRRKR